MNPDFLIAVKENKTKPNPHRAFNKTYYMIDIIQAHLLCKIKLLFH